MVTECGQDLFEIHQVFSDANSCRDLQLIRLNFETQEQQKRPTYEILRESALGR